MRSLTRRAVSTAAAGSRLWKAGSGQGQDLYVHALLVHQRQAAFAQIGETGAVVAAVGNGGDGIVRRRRGRPGLPHHRWQDVLFDGDQAQG